MTLLPLLCVGCAPPALLDLVPITLAPMTLVREEAVPIRRFPRQRAPVRHHSLRFRHRVLGGSFAVGDGIGDNGILYLVYYRAVPIYNGLTYREGMDVSIQEGMLRNRRVR